MRSRLLLVSAVTALVSTRVYVLTFGQSQTWPAVRVVMVSEPLIKSVAGETALAQTRVQVDSVTAVGSGGNPYTAAIALADAIHGDGSFASPTGLEHWRGSLGSPAYEVKGIGRLDRAVSYDAGPPRVIRVRQDYEVWTAA